MIPPAGERASGENGASGKSPEGPTASNPFSTRYVRPGAIAYFFAADENAENLVSRLAAAGWRGQIVGPHGSGKSSLLAALKEPLQAGGRRCFTIALRDGERKLPGGWEKLAAAAGANLIIIDGYEQLSSWSRWRLRVRCRKQHWGLLVTSHANVGLPALISTVGSLEMAQQLVQRLLPPGDTRVRPEHVAACYAAADGNMRETLFRLYDVWEEETRAGH